jgi:hypothetical protein
MEIAMAESVKSLLDQQAAVWAQCQSSRQPPVQPAETKESKRPPVGTFSNAKQMDEYR